MCYQDLRRFIACTLAIILSPLLCPVECFFRILRKCVVRNKPSRNSDKIPPLLRATDMEDMDVRENAFAKTFDANMV